VDIFPQNEEIKDSLQAKCLKNAKQDMDILKMTEQERFA
jgi:hypothetical protein